MADQAIMLFGKTIPFITPAGDSANSKSGNNLYQENRVFCANSLRKDDEHSGELKEADSEDDCEGRKIETKQEDAAAATSGECTKSDVASVADENRKLPPMDEDSAPVEISKPEEEQSDTSISGEKTLKKPDKILPCPRCNSMDTKFCYYNNYNVSQPRYFCKNCQRYWTDGGTMRNVPVGAGRRKNKYSASHYHHITVTESLQNPQVHLQNSLHHPSLNNNGTVLTFGSDAPLCESMASVFKLADKSTRNCTQNGFHAPQEIRISSSYGGGEISSEQSDGSSVTALGSKDENVKTGSPDFMMHNAQNFTLPEACFPGAPWPYPWNPAQWTTPLAQPTFCPPGYPMHLYPASAYWGCAVPSTWNVPCVLQPSSPKVVRTGSGPNLPTLGKHSRDENSSKADESGGENQTKESGNLWIPKTFRINDPGDAAKSSIWTTLGIKNNKTDPIISGGLFKAFRSESDEKNIVYENSSFLHANPAAFSRFLNFHESL